MTVAEILTQVRDNFAYDNDLASSLGDNPTDAQLVPYVNWACRSIARRIKLISAYIPITLTAGTQIYSLDSGTLISSSNATQVTRVHRVYIDNTPMLKPDRVTKGLYSFNEMERSFPQWKAATSGMPYAVCQFGNKLIFNTPIDSTTASKTNYIVAEYLPAQLSTSDLTQIPDLPVETHEAIAFLASIRISAPQITEAESYQRLNLYQSFITEALDAVKKQNEATMMDFGSTFGTKRRRFIQV